ncbi:MAG: methyltransferase domain-containing protein, partial [Alphaproteobacteria bacterium]
MSRESAGPADLTQDRFLGGRVTLRQPRHGYRAGVDPVLLAAATPARAGQSVLDLGCGVGAAALCLGARVGGLQLVGVERQPEYAALARRNAAENALAFEVHEADLAALPEAVKARAFDHVIMNPPYYRPEAATPSDDAGRAGALFEQTPLASWIDAATRRLRHRGWLTLIQRADRVPEVLRALDDRLGSVMLKPLLPREGRPAALVIVRARKGGRAPFRLLAPLVL